MSVARSPQITVSIPLSTYTFGFHQFIQILKNLFAYNKHSPKLERQMMVIPLSSPNQLFEKLR